MYIVSACLAGVNCNYKGSCAENERVVELVREGRAILVCPEQLGGMKTPRDPAEIKAGVVFDNKGNNVTKHFIDGAKEVLEIAKKYNCDKAILKSKSPSCGFGEIYDGNFAGILVDGFGITAKLLMDNGIEVISSNDY